MPIKNALRQLPVYKKIFLFSFFISFLIVSFTASFIYYYQAKQLETQLTGQAVGVANLWATTIPRDDIKKGFELKDPKHPAVKRLNKLVTLINTKNSDYLGGYLLSPIRFKDNKLLILAASKHYEEMEFISFSNYQPGPIFLEAFQSAVQQKKVMSTKIYKDRYGVWITAFSPIMDEKQNVIAVLGVDVDASVMRSYNWQMGAFIITAYILINSIVYAALRWGLKKTFAPVNEIITGINEVSNGNFDVKLHIKQPSDLTILSERFNLMTNHLSQLFRKLSDTYDEMQPGEKGFESKDRIEAALGEMEHIMENTRLQKELQRAEKMNAIGQLAASVAHEIRNPMTVVKGFLQIFLTKDHLNEEEHMYIQLMIEEMNRAEVIINEYLSMAKPDFEKMEKVSANEMSLKIMELMNTYAIMSKNIQMQYSAVKELQIRANKGELQQVLINMLKNAIEALEGGGLLELNLHARGSYCVFEIKDTGIGMTEEELSRLGTAFYSLKEKGTGIGLMVCYQIVERMKGKIHVKSVKGVGTSFEIYIPLWRENGEDNKTDII
ncbi:MULTISPECIES: ATP-binding protein [unclassified Bacillus (in: firmicutes)]|uniref:ATP-binding protein n=1 Tax=unclassified Bacillus (in: firmicutes) TaxID=185979 RepID=UPI0008E58F1D|nr:MULTISPECIES: ATP-binding protein [unclassified Bacillus (in: firmicutes)]SFA92263.1 Signal transduction histidine kinase [Bacillus sp. UNCCL13]SFQ85859.1 Signal transduction histidine kinase [Bacillus sp. cl95]